MSQIEGNRGPDLVNDGGLPVEEDSPRNVLPGATFTEEGREGIIMGLAGFQSRELTIRLRNKRLVIVYQNIDTIYLDFVLLAVKLPAGITHLDSGLNENRNHVLTLLRI